MRMGYIHDRLPYVKTRIQEMSIFDNSVQLIQNNYQINSWKDFSYSPAIFALFSTWRPLYNYVVAIYHAEIKKHGLLSKFDGEIS